MQDFGTLLQAIVTIAFVGGLALLAQWGRKNRGAEISLVVVVLFFSFLVAVSGLLVALVARSGALPPDFPVALSASGAAVLILAGVIGVALCVPPLRRITSRRTQMQTYQDDAARSGGVATANGPSGGQPPRRFWSDPVTFFALWLSVLMLSQNLLILLVFALSPDAFEATFSAAGRLSFVSIVASQFPFIVVAALGVGFGYRRNLRETLARLGYGPITLRQFGVVLLFIVGTLLLSIAFDALFAALQPELYGRVGEVSEGLVSTEGFGPLAAILFGLLIGVGAAAGEETLFRGALQPALGIPLASVLWASLHVQYGLSVLLVYIFVISVGWGILRNRINTTATFLVHAGYNFSLVILSYFTQI